MIPKYKPGDRLLMDDTKTLEPGTKLGTATVKPIVPVKVPVTVKEPINYPNGSFTGAYVVTRDDNNETISSVTESNLTPR
jgi:hypothetical protein